jgi:hypothetical protein
MIFPHLNSSYGFMAMAAVTGRPIFAQKLTAIGPIHVALASVKAKLRAVHYSDVNALEVSARLFSLDNPRRGTTILSRVLEMLSQSCRGSIVRLLWKS